MRKTILYKFRRTITYFLLFTLILSGCVSPLMAHAAANDQEGETIHISTVEEFLTFAKNCSIDTWSQDKIFILENDIDLSNTAFEMIPTFGGIFLGQGHTIKGLSLNNGSNYVGLFRYVQEKGEIYQLSVSGTATCGSGHSGLALLAGCNYGLISGCSSSGNVSGKDLVGSIAGVNEVTGVITDCSSNGVVYGSHFTGGISGNNKGSILNSSNHCFINTTASDNNIDLSSFHADAAITDFLTTENASSVTDIGGIAGCNSGIIRACTNNGSIGYQHVGYNVGGITGRQSGYIEGCINYGFLNGRKDIGGIVGQMEPSSELEFSQDTLAKLNTELDKLHQLLTKLNQDASGTSSSLTDQTEHLLTSVEDAQHAVDGLLGNAGNYFDDFSNLTDLTILPSPRPLSLEFLDKLPSPSPLETPMATLSPSPTPQASATPAHPGTAEPTATPEPTAALEPTATPGPTATPEPTAVPGPTAAPEPTATPEPTTVPGPTAAPGSNGLEDSNVLSENTTALKMEEEEFTSPVLNEAPLPFDFHVLPASDLDLDLDPVPSPTSSPAFKLPDEWIEDLPDEWMEDLPDVSGNDIHITPDLNREQVEKDLNEVQENIYEDAAQALKVLQDNVQNQASIISSRIASSRNSLSNSFSAILSDLRLLNDMLDDENQVLLNDLQAIIDELNVIGNLMTSPEPADPANILTDVSDEDQITDITGKVMNCANNGKINGDLNVGGIAGSLSRENRLDPENDFDLDESNLTLNFQYKERIVIRQCTSYGNVTGKTDCVGGIAGEMSLGSIINCTSSGTIASEGAMVGGVAGSSTSNIRNSSAKCVLKGAYQIGGIAGYGTNISDCYSMVQINEGEYYLGSIAGTISSDAVISNNYFVEGCPAGIDSISYEGKAQPLSYEVFMTSPGLPDIFNNIYLTFTADDETISVVSLKYGEAFHPDSLPEVPPKEGYIGSWPDFDQTSITFDQTIEALYTEYITTLASPQTTGERAVVLVEGTFGPKDSFTLTRVKDDQNTSTSLSESWKIAIQGTSTAPYTIRYLIPSQMEHPQISIYEDGVWKTVSAETDGSYCVFTGPSSETIFRCTDQGDTSITGRHIFLLIFVVGIIALLLAILFFRKNKRKKGISS